MAETLGMVTGVLTLLPLCRDGLAMIKGVFDAPRTLQLAVARVEFQQDVSTASSARCGTNPSILHAHVTKRFDEWREIWRNEDGEQDMNFELYAKSDPVTARKVHRQLALMALALFDTHAFEEQFGMKPQRFPDREPKDLTRFRLKDGENLTLETQGTFLERCKINMSIIKRCKFLFRHRDEGYNKLIDLLKHNIEELVTLGPAFELERVRKGECDKLRKMDMEELRGRAEAATYEARHTPPGISIGDTYHNISLAAKFSIVVRYQRQHAAYKFTMRDFRLDPAYALSSTESSTMALLFDYPAKKENRVVLIEWIDDMERYAEKDTRDKTLILSTPKPGQLLLPTCYGMVEDTANRRFGLVLAPPAHIRANLPSIMPTGAISQKRMPVSLKELLEKEHPACQQMLELGARFRLAKKLVDAVHMMHSVGWIHKNIRSNSILFFPAPNIPSSGVPVGPASGYPQPIGYELPLFTGLFNPRIDDILEEVSDTKEYRSAFSEAEIYRSVDPRQHRSKLAKDFEQTLDYYQHPDKRWNPSIRYSRSHDIYSLGCLLLEIGLWEPLETLVEIEDDDFERVKRGFQALTMKLDSLAGSVYGDIVRKCLAINVRERTEHLSDFCSGIAARLDKCWA